MKTIIVIFMILVTFSAAFCQTLEQIPELTKQDVHEGVLYMQILGQCSQDQMSKMDTLLREKGLLSAEDKLIPALRIKLLDSRQFRVEFWLLLKESGVTEETVRDAFLNFIVKSEPVSKTTETSAEIKNQTANNSWTDDLEEIKEWTPKNSWTDLIAMLPHTIVTIAFIFFIYKVSKT